MLFWTKCRSFNINQSRAEIKWTIALGDLSKNYCPLYSGNQVLSVSGSKNDSHFKERWQHLQLHNLQTSARIGGFFLQKKSKFIEFWKLLMYLTINMLQVFHVFKCKIKVLFFYQGWLIYHARNMVCHKKIILC